MFIFSTQNRRRINVWAGIFNRQIIGPFFYEQNLNHQFYCTLLQNDIIPAMNNVAAEEEFLPWFQQDGCPAHNTGDVRAVLAMRFGDRVIGNDYPTHWPARSPDLAPCDYFLWGYLHDQLYDGIAFENIEALENEIRRILVNIPQQLLINTTNDFYERLGFCAAANGGLFEHLF